MASTRTAFFLRISLMGFILGSCAIATPSASADALQYKLTALGSLPGATPGTAVSGINDLGQVVGELGGNAFLYSGGVMSPLNSAIPSGINDAGQLATDVSIFHAGNVINSSGVVVGNTSYGPISQVAATESDGTIIRLTSALSDGKGINNAGQVVGSFLTGGMDSSTHPFLYSNGVLTDLLSSTGFKTGEANAINNLGQVVGVADGHAFLYSNGIMKDLGTLYGGSSNAGAINDLGQIVGVSDYSSTAHAFLYQYGKMTDLSDLIQSDFGLTIIGAPYLNNEGQMAFNANVGGQVEAFLLTPVPEPTTLAFAAFAGATFLYRKKGTAAR